MQAATLILWNARPREARGRAAVTPPCSGAAAPPELAAVLVLGSSVSREMRGQAVGTPPCTGPSEPAAADGRMRQRTGRGGIGPGKSG